MNLVYESVLHTVFGKGRVTGQDGGRLTIQFSTGIKQFIYPDAFKEYLKLEDSDKQSALTEELREIQAQTDAKKLQELEEIKLFKALSDSEHKAKKRKPLRKKRLTQEVKEK